MSSLVMVAGERPFRLEKSRLGNLTLHCVFGENREASFSRNLVMVRAVIEARCACQELTGKAKAIPENCRPRELSVLARIEMPQRAAPSTDVLSPAIALCNKL